MDVLRVYVPIRACRISFLVTAIMVKAGESEEKNPKRVQNPEELKRVKYEQSLVCMYRIRVLSPELKFGRLLLTRLPSTSFIFGEKRRMSCTRGLGKM